MKVHFQATRSSVVAAVLAGCPGRFRRGHGARADRGAAFRVIGFYNPKV